VAIETALTAYRQETGAEWTADDGPAAGGPAASGPAVSDQAAPGHLRVTLEWMMTWLPPPGTLAAG
jgi:hypothetical protein